MVSHSEASDPAFWDRLYESGAFRQAWDRLDPPDDLVMAVAAGLIPDGGVTLDLGCGAGTSVIFLAGRGYSSIGLDVSTQALRVARERAAAAGVTALWLAGTAEMLPLADASVDVVHDFGCFHHIDDAGRLSLAQELARVMKPGAHFLLRGGRQPGIGSTYPLDDEAVGKAFREEQFILRPAVPYTVHAPGGDMPSHMVVLTRR